MADLSDFKRGQIIGACMAGVSAKKHWIIWSSWEYCLEGNKSIWERRKVLHTEAKIRKKAKAIRGGAVIRKLY